MTTYSSTIDTPVGPFTIIGDEDGAVLASGWTGDAAVLVPLIHPDLRETPDLRQTPDLRKTPDLRQTPDLREMPVPRPDLGAATRAAKLYHAGDLTAPDAVVVRQRAGGAFLAAAWKTLREVPAGEPVSYTELATRTGNPAANRAAAQACARNAAALFVPCHRVIRTDGTLGGFRWGPPIKQWLLDHEAGRR